MRPVLDDWGDLAQDIEDRLRDFKKRLELTTERRQGYEVELDDGDLTPTQAKLAGNKLKRAKKLEEELEDRIEGLESDLEKVMEQFEKAPQEWDEDTDPEDLEEARKAWSVLSRNFSHQFRRDYGVPETTLYSRMPEERVRQVSLKDYFQQLIQNEKDRNNPAYQEQFQRSKDEALEELMREYPPLAVVWEEYQAGRAFDREQIAAALGKKRVVLSELVARKKGEGGAVTSLEEGMLLFGVDNIREVAEILTNVPRNFHQMWDELAQLKADEEMGIDNASLRALLMEGTGKGEEYERARWGQIETDLEFLRKQYKGKYRETLGRTVAPLPTTWKGLKDLAAVEMAQLGIDEFSSGRLAQQERTKAREAAKHLRRGDVERAFKAKVEEARLFHQWKLAQRFENYRRQSAKLIKKIFKDSSKTRDVNIVSGLQGFLTSVGFATGTNRAVAKHLAGLEKYNPAAYASIMQAVDEAMADMGDGKLTMNKFAKIINTAKQMWAMAKESQEVTIGKKREEVGRIASEMAVAVGNIKDLPSWKHFEGVKDLWLSFNAAVTMVTQFLRKLDRQAGTNIFEEKVLKPIQEAEDTYVEKFAELSEEVGKLFKDYMDKQPKNFRDPVSAEEIDFTFKNKSELIGALLHTGNRGNLQRLIEGYGWGVRDEMDTLDTSRWDAFLQRAMETGIVTQTDMEFVQSIWDTNARLLPDAQEAYRKMYGTYYEEIGHRQIKTPWGTYNGGYYPAVASKEQRVKDEFKVSEEAILSGEYAASIVFPKSAESFTKDRAKRVVRQLGLDPGYALNHMGMVLRFIHLQNPVTDAAKILHHPNLRKAFDDKRPDVWNKILFPWLSGVVRQQRVARMNPGNEEIEKAASVLRTHSAAMIMTGNLKNAVVQFTGLTLAVPQVGLWSLISNTGRAFFGGTQFRRDINAKSKFMRQRNANIVFDARKEIETVLEKKGVVRSSYDWLLKHSYILQNFAQGQVDKIIWKAAYDKSYSQGHTEAAAVKFADDVVRKTQGSYNISDMARAERGNALMRLATMFSRFAVNRYNLIQENYADITKGEKFKVQEHGARTAMMLLWTVGIPEIAYAWLAVYAFRAASGDDDDDLMHDIAVNVIGNSAAAAIPIGGPLASHLIGKSFGESWTPPVRLSPVSGLVEDGGKFLAQIRKVLADEEADGYDIFVGAGKGLGLSVPFGKPVQKIIQGQALRGRDELDGDFWIRPELVGR